MASKTARVRLVMLKSSAHGTPTMRGLIQVRRMRHAPGRRSHWVLMWVRPQDATEAERQRAAKQERNQAAMIRTELKADAAQVWNLYTNATYKSGDLPVLAVREALQNSVDAMNEALASKTIERGRFDVEWDAAAGTLSFADNGVGMDHTKLHNVFLKLGASGDEKRKAGGSSAGGFGVAKAVILGCSPTSEWELHSRDNFISSEHLGRDVDMREQKRGFLAGTKVTVKGLDSGHYEDRKWDDRKGGYSTLADRLSDLLAASTLDSIDLYLNGQKVKPYFGRKQAESLDFPEAQLLKRGTGLGAGTTIKAYTKHADAQRGSYYVRINGLVQHRVETGWNTKLKQDVVIDLDPTAVPGTDEYPLSVSRDEFQKQHYHRFQDFRREFEKEELSNSAPRDYDTLHPEGDDAEAEGFNDFAAEVADFLANKELLGTLGDLFGMVRDIEAADSIKVHNARDNPEPRRPTPGGPVDGSWVFSAPRADPLPGFPGAGPVHQASDADADASPGLSDAEVLRVATEINKVPQLRDSINAYLQECGLEPSTSTTYALNDMVAGREVDQYEVSRIVDDIGRAAETAFNPGGNGMADAVKAQVLLDGIARIVPAVKKFRNPFGQAAAVKVSNRQYDKRKAKRFLEAPAKAMPLLLAWDATCRIVAKEYGLRDRFKPGFILEDGTSAMASSEHFNHYVMVNPDQLRDQVRAFAGKPNASRNIAHWLHHMAAHELAHVAAGLDRGHDETFCSYREDVGVKTAHLLPAIEQVVRSALKPAEPLSPAEKKIASLERQLAAMRAKMHADKRKSAEIQKVIAPPTTPRPQLGLFKGVRHGKENSLAGLQGRRWHEGHGQPLSAHRGRAGGDGEHRSRTAGRGAQRPPGLEGVDAAGERTGAGLPGRHGDWAPVRLLIGLRKAAQIGLFGPKPAGPKTGVGDKHEVTTHFRRTKTGKTAIVHEHQRAGQGHLVEAPAAPPKVAAAPQQLVQPRAPTAEDVALAKQHQEEAHGLLAATANAKKRRESRTAAKVSGGEAAAKDTGRKRVVHRDSGKKIGGARKDVWREVAAHNLAELEALGEAHKRCTKDAVLGAFDGDMHQALGSGPGAVALKQALWAAVATRPPNNPAARQVYVNAADWLRKALDQCHTIEAVKLFLDDWQHLTQGTETGSDLTAAEFHARYSTWEPKYPAGVESWGAALPPEKIAALNAQMTWRTDSNKWMGEGYRAIHSYTTADGVERFRMYKDKAGLRDVYGGYSAVLGPNISNIVSGWLKGSRSRPAFYLGVMDDARRRDKAQDWTGLVSSAPKEKADGDGDETEANTKWVRTVRDPKRVGGPSFRKAINGKVLQDDFGLRGVEFGNWLDDDDAEKHLTNAYGAFTDLADLMGLDRKAIAHSKQLAVAFGARGGGHFAAHYEASHVVINLTATKGAGTLAHEFAHFFDHMLTETVKVDPKSGKVTPGPDAWVPATGNRLGAVRAQFLSENDPASPVHAEVRDAYDGVMAAINGQDFSEAAKKLNQRRRALKEESRALQQQHGTYSRTPEGRKAWQDWADRRSKLNTDTSAYNQTFVAAGRRNKPSNYLTHAQQLGGYWERPHELFARAFESWAQDSLEGAGRLNTYLVDGTTKLYRVQRVKKDKVVADNLEPYPQGDERKAIHAAISNLVGAMSRHQALRKALQAGLDRSGDAAVGRPPPPKALHVESLLVDSKAQEVGRHLQELHRQALREIEQSTSPLQREQARQAAYNLSEAAGGLRWQAVTGSDETDLPRS